MGAPGAVEAPVEVTERRVLCRLPVRGLIGVVLDDDVEVVVDAEVEVAAAAAGAEDSCSEVDILSRAVSSEEEMGRYFLLARG